tara:strand:+ start:1244 stop:1690 length:447 start_codon:yes stop_codon:yes gene_type:complete
MNAILKELNKFSKQKENVLALVFILYILMDVPTPALLADFIKETYGNLVVILLVVVMFLFLNPIVAILGLVAGYELIKRSQIQTGVFKQNLLPSTEEKKFKQFERLNHIPKTLEEEVVKKMAPMTSSTGVSAQKYKPVVDKSVSSSEL